MSIDASTIPQQACRFLEKTPVASMEEDGALARSLAEQYPVALDMCLEAHDWSFASKLATLSVTTLPATDIADDDLPYAYALPGDFVMLREVLPAGTCYRLDERLLRADLAEGLRLRYTRRIDIMKQTPGWFRTYVALQLANLLAPQYLGTRTKRVDLRQDLDTAEARAIRLRRNDASHARLDGRAEQPDWADEAQT